MFTAFLPCRLGSQRVKNKNVRSFANVEGGLLKIKLDQLCRVCTLDKIIVSSNDLRVLDIANNFGDERIEIDKRSDSLASNTTTTDELIDYVPKLIKEGNVIWTHVTSPFFNFSDYENIIELYLDKEKEGFDSLMTVKKIQGFIWDKEGPKNYDSKNLKWPMTQNIKPYFEVDSAAFISNIKNYIRLKDRIGLKPYLYINTELKSFDIDWPEDFEFANKIYNALKND
jgi:CMP-N-acetylneuraminic acid synthetase